MPLTSRHVLLVATLVAAPVVQALAPASASAGPDRAPSDFRRTHVCGTRQEPGLFVAPTPGLWAAGGPRTVFLNRGGGTYHIKNAATNSGTQTANAQVVSADGRSREAVIAPMGAGFNWATISRCVQDHYSKYDIIFTETLDCGVVGEGFFAIAGDIRQVAGPQTRVIPERIRQFGQLVNAPALTKLNRVGNAAGFDLSALNIYSTRTYFPVREKLYDYTPLSEPFLLREYIYTQDMPHRRVNIEPYRSGKADGVLSWFEAEFVHETVTNSPGTHGHWHQAFHPFEITADVTARHPLAVKIADDGRISVL